MIITFKRYNIVGKIPNKNPRLSKSIPIARPKPPNHPNCNYLMMTE